MTTHSFHSACICMLKCIFLTHYTLIDCFFPKLRGKSKSLMSNASVISVLYFNHIRSSGYKDPSQSFKTQSEKNLLPCDPKEFCAYHNMLPFPLHYCYLLCLRTFENSSLYKFIYNVKIMYTHKCMQSEKHVVN